MEDTGGEYLVTGHFGNTFATTTVVAVQKKLLSDAASVDTGPEVTFQNDQSYVWHPGTGRCHHVRRVRKTCEMDIALEPLVTAPRNSK